LVFLAFAVALPNLSPVAVEDFAGELVSEKLGRKLDPLSPAPNDRKTYELIRSGDTAGMFQLESPGQMSLQRRLKPRRLEHIISGISLFRPGPLQADLLTPYVARKNGQEPYSVPLTELDDILRPTYGVLVYQEQLLEMAQRVSGCSLAEADSLTAEFMSIDPSTRIRSG